jgi:hypothetical protein
LEDIAGSTIMTTSLGEVLLEFPATDAEIAHAVAAAYGVEKVTVWPVAEVDDVSADIVVQREDFPGEFPQSLALTATNDSDAVKLTENEVIERMRSIARTLGRCLLTDEAGIDPVFSDDYLLVTPSGDTAVVQVTVEGLRRGELELTQESRTRLVGLTAKTPATAR